MSSPYPLNLMYDEFEAVKAGLPKAKFSSCSALLVRLRTLKSEGEIQAMRRTCEITDNAHKAVPDLLRTGKQST